MCSPILPARQRIRLVTSPSGDRSASHHHQAPSLANGGTVTLTAVAGNVIVGVRRAHPRDPLWTYLGRIVVTPRDTAKAPHRRTTLWPATAPIEDR